MRLEFKYWLIVLVSVVFLLTSTLLVQMGFIPHLEFKNVIVHSSIEAVGGILGILIFSLIFMVMKDLKIDTDYYLIGFAFLGMGVFDLLHSIMYVRPNFVWTHIISVMNGGIWFSALLLPDIEKRKLSSLKAVKWIISIWAIIWVILILFENQLPQVIDSNGKFTMVTNIINTVAGIGFLMGTFHLLKRFSVKNELNIFLIAIIGLLQGISRITFHWSHIWDIDWWTWHVFRLFGSLLVFIVIIRLFNKIITDLKSTSKTQKTIIDAMPFGLMLINKDKKILQLNEAGQQISGYSGSEILNTHCYESVCGSECDQCPVVDLNESIKNEKKILIQKDGTKIPIIKTVKKIRINNEEILLEGFVDISEMEEARTKLKFSEEKFKDIFNSISSSIFIIDNDGAIVDCNDEACKQYAYTKDELLKLPAHKLLHPDYLHEFERFFKDLQEKGKFRGNTIDQRKDGSTFYTDVSGSMVSIDGKPHLLGVVLDISELKKAEEELQYSIKKLNRTR